MVARPRVDDSCTQTSVRYVTRVKHELNFGSALVARFCKQNQQSARKRNNNFVFIFRRNRAPRCCNDVEVGSGAGTEGGWCEFGSHHSHTLESLVHSFTFTVFFLARPEKFVAGGCKENTRPLTTSVAESSVYDHRLRREHATVLCDRNVGFNVH